MKSPLLLDCTLRDGGFVNDWNFGFGSIKSIVSRLDYAGVDLIEVGFIDERRVYDKNRSIFPDTDSILPLFKGYQKSSALILGMIDFGTCSIDKVSDQTESCLDGIRVIFKKNDQDEAIELLRRIREKGYKIFVNPVSITEYSHEEMKRLISKINKIGPFAVSVVDTYGLMHARELMSICDIFDSELEEDAILGYHAHNNFQMAYANSISILERESKRTVAIDGSLFGMGKSAGNACSELLAMYMNEYCDRNFMIDQIQEAIDVDIMKEYAVKYWGYNFDYFISALNDCHPTYVQHLIEKKVLSVKSTNDILARIPDEQKLRFDNHLVEGLFSDYQNQFCDDRLALEALKKEFTNRKILLIGPGKTIYENRADVDEFIKEHNPVVVSINFLNELYPIDFVFMGNSKRYSQFFHEIYRDNLSVKIICTSNITELGMKIDFFVNYSSLLSENETIRDNPLMMFLRLLCYIGNKEIFLAGFDGYTEDNKNNYYTDYVRLLFGQHNVMLRNEAIKEELKGISRFMRVHSITPTRYL